jgi:hypothetical protein
MNEFDEICGISPAPFDVPPQMACGELSKASNDQLFNNAQLTVPMISHMPRWICFRNGQSIRGMLHQR